MSIYLYSTLTRKKEKFRPAEEGIVRMYVCGPTTYNLIHLGNARPVVFFDTVRRYFLYRGCRVYYIQNFTDVDDKVIARAREEKKDPGELAQRYIDEYFRDVQELNVKEADVHPRVSKNIEVITTMIKELLDKGYAYSLHGDVFFRVKKFGGYGKLSGRDLTELRAGARVEIDEKKEDPLDFALWKSAKEGEPAWESPWGWGRPGWHIECSAMALKYLGADFDIHGGGSDLIFPHHENEIAQAEAAAGRPFARYWMHNGFITVNQEKMSKSLGNFFLLRDILSKFPGDVVRFYLLATHYRSPLDFDDSRLRMAQASLERLKNAHLLIKEKIRQASPETGESTGDAFLEGLITRVYEEFEEAMDDDFNTSLALTALFNFCREGNALLNNLEYRFSPEILRRADRVFQVLGGEVLGLFDRDPQDSAAESEHMTGSLLELILEVRQAARKRKDWETADYIRDRLQQIGIVLEDTPHGTRWKNVK